MSPRKVDQIEEMSRPRRYAQVLAPALFELLRRDAIAMGPADCTYWATAESARDTSLGVAVMSLARHIQPLETLAGVEVWVRAKAANDGMPLHFDKDETLARLYGKLRHPDYSSVLYLTDQGGPTLVIDRHQLGEQDIEDRYLSWPSVNTFLVFPGHMPHCVLAEQEGDKRNGNVLGQRMSLLMNWWSERPLSPASLDLPAHAFSRFRRRRQRKCVPQPAELQVLREATG